jgi:hypothetical protein
MREHSEPVEQDKAKSDEMMTMPCKVQVLALSCMYLRYMRKKLIKLLKQLTYLLTPKEFREPVKKLNRKTHNTYEASYYMMCGALVDTVEFRKGAGGETQWWIHLSNVSSHRVEDWNLGKANVDLRQFEASRMKLKKIVRKLKS